MSDPRNVAHDKKVSQEKKQHGEIEHPESTANAQPGRKPAMKEKHGSASVMTSAADAAADDAVVPDETASSKPNAALEGSLTVLAQLKDLEFHSRANLERLAALGLTVEDELKQQELAVLLSEVYSAQNAVQTKLTALIEAYKTECDGMQR
jgi:predicted TIM-barrel fold metal-dependent hydrolase